MNTRQTARQTARPAIYILATILLLTACASAAPSPAPTPAPLLTTAQLKYAVLDRFGELSWCDPDFYPIAQEDEQALARQRVPEIRQDAETYAAITGRLDIDPNAELTDDQTVAVYREWKLLNAVALTPAGTGFTFDLIFVVDEGLGTGRHVAGTIDQRGAIDVTVDEQSFLTSCPICLSRGTLIDTPTGPVPIEQLRLGDLVWTVDASGKRVALPLERIGSTPVPATHQVVHLVFDDGRELWVSPGHPLADGRDLGNLRPGDVVDGAVVVTADLVGYDGGATFDILPAGATGLYWANGVLLASTL